MAEAIVNQKHDGGPAFPRAGDSYSQSDSLDGMSLRDYFAAKAMAACIAADPNAQNYSATPDVVADWAYAFADAMIAKAEGAQ